MIHRLLLRVGILISLLVASLGGWAPVQALGVPQLVVSQFKITSSAGQFVTLYNQSDQPANLADYEVDYVNGSGKLSSLPIAGQLAPHAFYLLSDDQLQLCYQVTINAVSLGFATTSGTLQVWQLSSDKTSKQLQDSVSWASKQTAGAVTLPAQNDSNTVSLLRQPTAAVGGLQVASPGSGSWQAVVPDAADACVLDAVATQAPVTSAVTNPGIQLGVGQAPPATIISLAADSSSGPAGPSLPAADVGLSAPQLTELLPNPSGTGNDATDEYIELYNPNSSSFDLSGFSLQTGATTKHTYTFPGGVSLPPLAFTAFFSADTGLALSNTSGQAALLDPFGNQLGQTDAYGTAKDGLAWALANGKWYWTTQATPASSNVIKQTVPTSKAGAKTASSKSGRKTTGVKGAVTTTAAGGAGSASTTDAAAAPPLHPYVLAAVAILAVGYGVYEYRHDLANRFHQFRTNRAARRQARG